MGRKTVTDGVPVGKEFGGSVGGGNVGVCDGTTDVVGMSEIDGWYVGVDEDEGAIVGAEDIGDKVVVLLTA